MRTDYALTASQRVDARAALDILAGTGITLQQAARGMVAGKKALDRRTVTAAVDAFVLDRARAGLRDRTVEWYIDKLRFVAGAFGPRWIDEVTRGELLGMINAVPGSPGSRAAIGRAARALWSWAFAQTPAIVTANIALSLPLRAKKSTGDAAFLTVEQVAAIMATVGPYQSALAVLFFAGVRPDELAGRGKPRLLWANINVSDRLIRIPANVAKTGKVRTIEGLPPTVWAWLVPGKPDDPVSPARTRQALERAQAAIGGAPWPHDATRHTFASYALALTNNAGAVSMWLGHEGSTGVIHRHYRGVTTRAEAERFFSLRP